MVPTFILLDKSAELRGHPCIYIIWILWSFNASVRVHSVIIRTCYLFIYYWAYVHDVMCSGICSVEGNAHRAGR